MEEDRWSILGNIDPDDAMRNPIYLELERLEKEKQPIFKLPNHVKEGNVKAYEPQLVSIGPYHYGKQHLKPMEVHKQKALSKFVEKSRVPIQYFKLELIKIVDQLKESYAELDEAWKDDDNKFVELMILDGCFILEFLFITKDDPANGYAPTDPMFSYNGKIVNYNAVMQDLVLVENQLPYLVLSTLLSIGRQASPEDVQGILSWMMLAKNQGPGLHMLDIFMRGILEGSNFKREEEVRYSASELYEFGIQFKKVGSYKNIKFDRNKAILNLPSILINDFYVRSYINMKAFEQRVGEDRKFNSYICLIGILVQSAKDVRVLQSQGIIINGLDSDEAVVEVIKELRKDAVVDRMGESSLVLEQMSGYCKQSTVVRKRKFRNWISNLRENYFGNPWTSISVAAAAFLLLLTVIQTVYTVCSFYSVKN
ncbi:Protein of unknown function DUF247 [Macleaya cordata]|uniref:Uncharacterized protein n=1 Tax=Macleaya cordata TaxID=56857 RepID=A0A200PXL4_MACCD|nr:Protein of unknown function DUF247 [Macleaya cordata]